MAPRKFSSPVIGLIGCGCACDRQGNVFLRFKLSGINRLGIQVKRGCYFGVTQQSLNRLHVFIPADQERGEAVTKVMEAEPFTRHQSNADLEGSAAHQSQERA